MTEALKHAEAAAKANDSKSIVEHAEAAKTHAKTADEHLDAGITSLKDTIDHGKLKHTDLTKKSADRTFGLIITVDRRTSLTRLEARPSIRCGSRS